MLLCWVYEYLAFASTLFFNYDIIIIIIFLQRIGMRAQEQLGESSQPPAKKKTRKNKVQYI